MRDEGSTRQSLRKPGPIKGFYGKWATFNREQVVKAWKEANVSGEGEGKNRKRDADG